MHPKSTLEKENQNSASHSVLCDTLWKQKLDFEEAG